MPEYLAELAWLLLPLAVAAGASIVTGFLMRARAEVASARERQALAEARTLLSAAQRIMEDRVEAAEATARRQALDEFLADVRVEERRSRARYGAEFVAYERICFRSIPLTPWFEQGTTALEPVPSRAGALEMQPASRGRRLLA